MLQAERGTINYSRIKFLQLYEQSQKMFRGAGNNIKLV